MAEIIFFKPRAHLDAEQNLKGFIEHCRQNLTLYEDQGGFAVNLWHFVKGTSKHAMAFSKYTDESNPYSFTPMDEPFLSFAKAYVRYAQSQKQVSSVGNKLAALRAVHDALLELYGTADVLKTDGTVQSKVEDLLKERYPGSDVLFRFGCQLVLLYDFLVEKSIVPTLPKWKNPWQRERAKAERTDRQSREWQEERCPSQHHMLALADCFARAETVQDRYWSSVIALLMVAPSRAGELLTLTVDALHEDNGHVGICWVGEKGFGHTIKWVPTPLKETVIEAFRHLIEIGQPARDAARFAYEHPGVFYRHEQCVTPENFPEDAPLDALQFAYAMGFGQGTITRMGKQCKAFDSDKAWHVLNARSTKWIQALRMGGGITYRRLSEHVLGQYASASWPDMEGKNRRVWESLLLIRENEVNSDKSVKPFSWVMPDVNQINYQLAPRSGLKNPPKTIFQRFGIVDEDGTDIALTSHQVRVWLSTNAERGGMDAWKLAQWAGRVRVQDNRHYDLRTEKERDDQVRQILKLEESPSALQAIELNLPVPYTKLGINRVGVADVTEYGMCVHDYAMSPCSKSGECMTCREHVCIKGMPKTLERIKRLEAQVESQLESARRNVGEGVYGASRWEEYFSWKLAHIRTQRVRLESEDTPVGAVLWIPLEHDPSPVHRALEQQGFQTAVAKDELVDESVIAGLLGVDDA